MDPKYFECHITIEPVFEERLDIFTELCKRHKFRPAKLLMQKNREDKPERSDKDTFCTGHAKSYEELEDRMYNLLAALKAADFQIWRYKIEAILLDVKVNG